MLKRIQITLYIFVIFCGLSHHTWAQKAQGFESKYFEIRKYYAHDGKLDELISRFEDHTYSIFERIGMENIAYFLPMDNKEYTMTYILGYPDKASRDKLWQKFIDDPEWREVYQRSTKNGALVKKIEETFMVLAPGLNKLPKPLPSGVIQLRKYDSYEGKLFDLQRRFKDNTQKLFKKHGFRNYLYWVTDESDGSQAKLIYLLGHRDQMSFEKSLNDFIGDPQWIKVRDESQADGKIVEKIETAMFVTLPFSPIK